MTARERICSAATSRNLADRTDDGVADIDIIRACGMVAQTLSLGVSLWRLKYAQDSRELGAVMSGITEMVRARHEADMRDAVAIVQRVLWHWLDDGCDDCDGRGYKIVPGTPMLSDELCPVCRGTGRVPFAGDAREAWVLEQLDRMEREAAGAIMRKLAGEMDL